MSTTASIYMNDDPDKEVIVRIDEDEGDDRHMAPGKQQGTDKEAKEVESMHEVDLGEHDEGAPQEEEEHTGLTDTNKKVDSVEGIKEGDLGEYYEVEPLGEAVESKQKEELEEVELNSPAWSRQQENTQAMEKITMEKMKEKMELMKVNMEKLEKEVLTLKLFQKTCEERNERRKAVRSKVEEKKKADSQ
jgi:hypothetical protein